MEAHNRSVPYNNEIIAPIAKYGPNAISAFLPFIFSIKIKLAIIPPKINAINKVSIIPLIPKNNPIIKAISISPSPIPPVRITIAPIT